MNTMKRQDEKSKKILNIFEDEVHKKPSKFFCFYCLGGYSWT